MKKFVMLTSILCLILFGVSFFCAEKMTTKEVYANSITSEQTENLNYALLPNNWLSEISHKTGKNMSYVSQINFINNNVEITDENQLSEDIGFEYNTSTRVLNIFSSQIIMSPETMNEFIPTNYLKLELLNFENFALQSDVLSLSNLIAKNTTWQQNPTKLRVIFGEYFDTSNVKDMSKMFDDCKKLNIVEFGEAFNTENVEDMSYMFYNCYQLEQVNVGGFDTSNVKDMSKMFYYCRGLTNLDVSNFDTSNVTDMNNMFYGCSSIEELDVSGFVTSNVKDMSYMFCDLEKITELDVSGFDTSSVESMRSMFDYLPELLELDVAGFNTSNVTDMCCMFSSIYKIEVLDTSGFDTSNVIDMCGMFNYCEKLQSVDISNFDTSNVEDMSSMFAGLIQITELDVSHLNFENCTSLCETFAYCDNLEYVNIKGIDTSNVEDFDYMFSDCYNLKKIDGIEELNVSKAKYISGMFCDCFALESLNLSKWDVRNVEYMSNIFDMNYITELEDYDTINLKYLNLSGWQLNSVYDDEWSHSNIFTGCNSLKTIVLPFYAGKFEIELPHEFYVVNLENLDDTTNVVTTLIDYTPTTQILQKVGTNFEMLLPDAGVHFENLSFKDFALPIAITTVLTIFAVLKIQRKKAYEKEI